MKTYYISQIIHRYFTGDYPSAMQNRLQAWLISKDKASLKEETVFLIWSDLQITNDESVYESLHEIKQKLGLEEKEERNSKGIFYKRDQKRSKLSLSLVAVALLCLVAGWWHHSTASRQWTHITAAYGKTAECLLPDSSAVWINPGTTISYPTEFNGNSREVRLCGEARFAVTKNSEKPFIVHTKTCTIQVVGTVFQISDYPENQQAITRLEEGSIEVSPANHKRYTLSPNQKMIIDKTAHTITILPTKITNWEEEALNFEEIPLHDIFQALKRHYGIAFVYQNFHPSNDRYSIKFNRKETMEQALDLLQALTENFIWSKHNHQIIIRSWNPSHTK